MWRNTHDHYRKHRDDDVWAAGEIEFSVGRQGQGHQVRRGYCSIYSSMHVQRPFQKPNPAWPPRPTNTLRQDGWKEYIAQARNCLIVESALLFIFHPDLYLLAREVIFELAREAARQRPADLEQIYAWPSVFTVVDIICNRESPLHRDIEPPAGWLDIIMTFAPKDKPYSGCIFVADTLQEGHYYPPGTIIICNSSRVRHGASAAVGERACIISYMRQHVAKYFGFEPQSVGYGS